MVTPMLYSGTFSGLLVLHADPTLDYSSTQSVDVVVKQDNIILAETKIKNIGELGQYFNLSYNYRDFVNPIQLIIKTLVPDDQFNRDNSVELTNLEIDNLYTVKKLITGKFFKNNQLIDVGNVLYDTGELLYEFKLPIFREIR
jgi:hypothetical protein